MGSNTNLVNEIKESIDEHEQHKEENVFSQLSPEQSDLSKQSDEFISYMRKSEHQIEKLEKLIDLSLMLSEERSYASLLEKSQTLA